jgi:hypothetical protein
MDFQMADKRLKLRVLGAGYRNPFLGGNAR